LLALHFGYSNYQQKILELITKHDRNNNIAELLDILQPSTQKPSTIIHLLQHGKTDADLKKLLAFVQYHVENNTIDETVLAASHKVVSLSQEFKDSSLQSTALGLLGSVYSTRNNYATSILYLETAIQVAKIAENGVNEASWKSNLAEVYREMGDYHVALRYAEEAIIQHRVNSDTQNLLSGLYILGNCYYALQKYEDALKCCKEFISIKESYSQPVVEEDYNRLYLTLLACGQTNEAQEIQKILMTLKNVK
jgi:tetratricopeptide (TPR) repeat protein